LSRLPNLELGVQPYSGLSLFFSRSVLLSGRFNCAPFVLAALLGCFALPSLLFAGSPGVSPSTRLGLNLSLPFPSFTRRILCDRDLGERNTHVDLRKDESEGEISGLSARACHLGTPVVKVFSLPS
jgi:hypothetical protein